MPLVRFQNSLKEISLLGHFNKIAKMDPLEWRNRPPELKKKKKKKKKKKTF